MSIEILSLTSPLSTLMIAGLAIAPLESPAVNVELT